MFCVEQEAMEHMSTYICVEREALENIVVKESFLWPGFKRSLTYSGWKRDENGSASIYKQVSEIRMVHSLSKQRLIQAALQSSSYSSCSKRPVKRIIPSSNQYEHI